MGPAQDVDKYEIAFKERCLSQASCEGVSLSPVLREIPFVQSMSLFAVSLRKRSLEMSNCITIIFCINRVFFSLFLSVRLTFLIYLMIS